MSGGGKCYKEKKRSRGQRVMSRNTVLHSVESQQPTGSERSAWILGTPRKSVPDIGNCQREGPEHGGEIKERQGSQCIWKTVNPGQRGGGGLSGGKARGSVTSTLGFYPKQDGSEEGLGQQTHLFKDLLWLPWITALRR